MRPFAVTNFANFLHASNSNRSIYPARFLPASLRLPAGYNAGYNVASGGLREGEFAPKKADSVHDVRFTLG